MQSSKFLVLTVVLSVSGIPALGTDLEKSSALADVTLVAPGGEYDNSQFDLPCAAGVFKADLNLSNPTYSEKWESASQVIFFPSKTGEPKLQGVVLAVHTTNNNPPFGAKLYVTGEGRRNREVKEFDTRPEFPEPLHIEATWDAYGVAKVTLNSRESQLVRFDRPFASIELVGSGATVAFTHMELTCTAATTEHPS